MDSVCGSYLNGVLPLGEVDLPLPLLLRLLGVLVLGKATAHRAGVLWSEVERKVLLVLVEQAELGALVDVDDGENARDGLADVVAVGVFILAFFGRCGFQYCLDPILAVRYSCFVPFFLCLFIFCLLFLQGCFEGY